MRSVSRTSILVWISSSASTKVKVPASISPAIAERPLLIAAPSSALMMPWAASIAAWARLPAISSAQSLASKPIETLMACITASGPAPKRPPHCSCWEIGVLLLSVKPSRPFLLSRRSVIAGASGLALAGGLGNSAGGANRRERSAGRRRGADAADADRGAAAALHRRQGAAADIAGLSRPHAGGQSLGHLVRPLHRGNSQFRRAGAAAERRAAC